MNIPGVSEIILRSNSEETNIWPLTLMTFNLTFRKMNAPESFRDRPTFKWLKTNIWPLTLTLTFRKMNTPGVSNIILCPNREETNIWPLTPMTFYLTFRKMNAPGCFHDLPTSKWLKTNIWPLTLTWPFKKWTVQMFLISSYVQIAKKRTFDLWPQWPWPWPFEQLTLRVFLRSS